MLKCSPVMSAPEIKMKDFSYGDISTIIAFTDKDLSGAVALCFPRGTALWVYERMAGDKEGQLTAKVRDTVAELANIVAGGAKTILSKSGANYHIAIPTIVMGKNHSLSEKFNAPIVTIPFTLEGHPFMMEAVMRKQESHPK